MYKHIALLALLLPFSGYAITKQERREEILQELHTIDARSQWLKEVIKHNFWVVYISGDSFKKEFTELYERAIALGKEITQIELELVQEKTCSKK